MTEFDCFDMFPHASHFYAARLCTHTDEFGAYCEDCAGWCPGRVDVDKYNLSLTQEEARAALRVERNSAFLRNRVVAQLNGQGRE